MPTLTIKNVPDELYELLKQAAATNRRSINSQVIVCLEQALGSAAVDPEELLRWARVLREKSAGYVISDAAFDQAKRRGRP
jgi:antitoxin FitA